MGRLILVSNRLPLTVRRQGRETVLAPSTGGLVAGLGPVHGTCDSLWIGSLGGEHDSIPRSEIRKRRLVPVHLPREQARQHYEGFSNGVLWPLFHYFLESVDFEPRDFEAYRAVNERFADVVAENARPSDWIWIHDYHLMLLPSLLRSRLPRARIGFFLHIPFPSSEVFRVLPSAEPILRGLLGADMIGLHTYDYARHLTTAYRRILGMDVDGDAIESDGSRTHIRVLPLGIDSSRLSALAASEEVERRLIKWRRRSDGRKVVLSVDRLDYSKGIPLRLEAYRRILQEHPEWRTSILFLQIAVPTRSSIPQYKQLRLEVEQKIGQINGELGDLGVMPLHYIYRSVPPEELAALYRLADVAAVTPLRDGMNLVAKEYVASRTDDTGVLVLSEFAGAASELGEAIVVNPWDLDGFAAALDRALRMPAGEARARMSALRRRVALNNVEHWSRSFIGELERCANRGATTGIQSDEGWTAALVRDFARAESPLVVLAYDGTLRAFESRPEKALPDDELLDLLGRLSGAPRMRVALMSGRDRSSLDRWFGDLPITLVAEHGVFVRPGGRSEWKEIFPGLDRSWMPSVEDAMSSYVSRTPRSFIERKHAALAWHYRDSEPALGLRQGRELAHHLTEYFANRPIRIIHGTSVVEAVHDGVGKGRAYQMLVGRLGATDFTLVAGDDRSDEGIFRSVPEGVWSVKIGPGDTFARHRLESPSRLRALIETALTARAAPGQTRAHRG